MKLLLHTNNEKIDNVNSRTLIISFSNCGKTYLMNYNPFQKHEPTFIIAKSLNQYPNIKAQTSDEIQPSENYENSTVLFNDLLLSKQKSNIDLFSTRGRHNIINVYIIIYIARWNSSEMSTNSKCSHTIISWYSGITYEFRRMETVLS